LGRKPGSPSALMAAVEQILQPSQSEMFFCQVPVLVEGTEDVAFLCTYLRLTNRWGEFRRLGCHLVVCGGKTSMSRPLAIANGLDMPAFIVFDGDTDDPARREETERDNRCLLLLSGQDEPVAPGTSVWGQRAVMWRTKILNELKNEAGEAAWNAAETAARRSLGFEEGVGQKNPLLVAACIEELWKGGFRSGLLEKLCKSILTFADQQDETGLVLGESEVKFRGDIP
ncbi:MAG: TOPRIM nucleotidyl transferase/hydrolase domain-containing protein, partial [Thermotogota bacterium]